MDEKEENDSIFRIDSRGTVLGFRDLVIIIWIYTYVHTTRVSSRGIVDLIGICFCFSSI